MHPHYSADIAAIHPHSRKLGPYSRPKALAMVDGRRSEAKVMADHRAELVQHCGGAPSATQRALIERAVALHLRLRLMDIEMTSGRGMSEKNGREYLAWNNAYTRTVKQLGMKGVSQRTPTVAELMGQGRAA